MNPGSFSITLWVILGAGLASEAREGEPGGDDKAAFTLLGSIGSLGKGLGEGCPEPASRVGELGEPVPGIPLPASSRNFLLRESGPDLSLVLETGTYFKELRFQAVAENGTERTISGWGLVPVELEGNARLGKDWSAGLGALGAFSEEVELWGIGPQVTWRFLAGHEMAPHRPPETEHSLKGGVFYEEFVVTEKGFGSFRPTVAPQIGYQFRTPLGGEGWTFLLDVRYEYAPFRYREPVLSGDRSISAHGVFLGLGVGYLF